MNIAELEHLLGQLILPDTAVIKAATNTLNKQHLKNPACVPALVEIICKSAAIEIRQMGAVLLKKKIVNLWNRVDPHTQNLVKKALLESLLNENTPIVRHAVAMLVSTIAKFEVPANKWKELLEFLYKCCNNPVPAYRETGFYLLANLIEPIAEQLRPHFPQLFTLFHQSLRDPDSIDVKITTCQCLDALSSFLSSDAEINMFRQCIPLMIEVIQTCLNKGDEENAISVFEVFDDLIECEVPVLAKSIPSLAEMFMQIASNTNLEENTRVKAVNFIYWIVQYKKKALQRNKLIEPIVNGLMPLIAEDKEDEEDEEQEEETISSMAAQTIDIMALNLPPDQVIPIILRNIENYFQSGSPQQKKAAMISMAVIIEGSSEFLRNYLPGLVSSTLSGLKDLNQGVREAACLAVEQLSIYIQPEICQHHATLLPALFEVMSGQNSKTTEKACMALEAFCEHLGDDITSYLHPLMEKLVQMLQHGNLKIQETVICAIGSTAHAADKKFLPYFPQVMQYLRLAMGANAPDQLQLRSIATDTLGTVALAVGKEAFAPILPEAMKLAIEGLNADDSYIRECTWSFFVSMAKLFEEDFSMYLEVVMPMLFTSCLNEDGVQIHQEEDDDFKDEEEIEGERGEYQEGEDVEETSFSVATSFLQEKEMACLAIGEIFQHVGKNYLPYFPQGIEVLKNMIEYFHPDVRSAAVTSYSNYVVKLHELFDPYEAWNAQVTVLPHQDVQQMLQLVIPAYMHILTEEDERSVVSDTCQRFSDILTAVGPFALNGVAESLGKALLDLLTKKAACQTVDVEGDDESSANPEEDAVDEEEEAELDALLIDSVADLIGAMAKAMQRDFLPYFQIFYPHIIKYFKNNRPVADRSMAVGCLAEIVFGMKDAIIPFADEIYKVFIKAVGDADDEVKNNAAYGLGVLCESVGPQSSKYYHAILKGLHELMSRGDISSTIDNAAGAVARLMITNQNSVPLDQVLPVFFSVLPLKSDFVENRPVFQAIFLLFSQQHPYVFQNLGPIFKIFSRVLNDPKQLTDETRAGVISLIRELATQCADLSNQAMATLESGDQQVIVQALNSQ